jgi:hypothetical protein
MTPLFVGDLGTTDVEVVVLALSRRSAKRLNILCECGLVVDEYERNGERVAKDSKKKNGESE